jgi:hypothetical protein
MSQVERVGIDHEFQRAVRRAMGKLRDGTPVEIEYAIEIDWERMRDMVERAARNKSKRSKSGPVMAYVARINRTAEGGAA